MAKEKILIGIDDKVIELKGAELEAFLEQRDKDQVEEQARKDAQKVQQELKISAYKKLGLTDEEISAII